MLSAYSRSSEFSLSSFNSSALPLMTVSGVLISCAKIEICSFLLLSVSHSFFSEFAKASFMVSNDSTISLNSLILEDCNLKSRSFS